MSTFMANKGNIERKWYVIDAAGKPMGKTAVAAADLLRGKRKVTYTPHADCGDNVIIINASKAILTGNKMEQKYYRTHSGWVGGLKETKYRILMQEKPELAMRVASHRAPSTVLTMSIRPVRRPSGPICASTAIRCVSSATTCVRPISNLPTATT